VALNQKGDGQVESWSERRLVGRSVRHAQAAAAALRARGAQALAQMEALNQRGRGNKRLETVSAWRQAVVGLVQRYGVEDLVWCRLPPPGTSRPVRADRGQPAWVAHDRQATVEVCVDEAALEAALRRLGWRVYGTHQPLELVALAQAGRASRRADQVERSFGRLKGPPLSLTPRDVQRDDQATGLMRWLSSALRVLTWLAWVGRRPWATEGAALVPFHVD
jgi:hypothetical protein